MPENILNCQNLPCPEAVIRAKRLLEADAPDKLTVIVHKNMLDIITSRQPAAKVVRL